ncbi:2OG-Fe(II) oxygenase [Myxococcus sp. RHSTA-1-4]|uniref:2OG-Fe(II) oxygenase n=1 Tax=Myxococcus sp. RHSTA-1-4 TaxID=2874601 RepID=UPI00272E6C8A|nr:2OG-Fe(II) oxygenase [Myxococcus sp. RHSTA-1-4]MBZ4420106.1 2OG-Fe(II) oxygenase [Myxococcus sp. RHSTA-1-4]
MRFQPPWSGAFRLQTFVHRTPEALPPTAVESIRKSILDSPLLSDTNLSGQFSGTYGFSITFRREATSDVEALFPAFAPFLQAALLPECNAFLLNPLLVQRGRGVGAHIDRSLEYYGAGIGCPVAVSVLYVQVPERLSGGELRLYHRGNPVAALAPMPRSLVTFRGDLVHEVAAVETGASGLSEARISLVVEQYRVPGHLTAGVPRFEARTRAGAAA